LHKKTAEEDLSQSIQSHNKRKIKRYIKKPRLAWENCDLSHLGPI